MRVRVFKITQFEGYPRKTDKFGLAVLMLEQSCTFILKKKPTFKRKNETGHLKKHNNQKYENTKYNIMSVFCSCNFITLLLCTYM